MNAQKWVDTLYSIQSQQNIEYGIAEDFAGNMRHLLLDISYPTNDTIPICGRPLMVMVHGGSFLGGSKEDPVLKQLTIDFAKRGYFTANINYLLGMFQTEKEVHCNVTGIFNTPWDCSNMADSSEWYRGNFRGMQDMKGAIRYLVNRAADYHIDPQQVFLVGESAGGFIAMQTAYLDDETEKHASCFALEDVLAPNAIYEMTCVQNLGFDTSIVSLNLQRPDLGSIEGTLNLENVPYLIKGVGNFYGGMMQNLFSVNTYVKPPKLYLYHQPNDLVVPFQQAKVLDGLNAFFSNNFGCANLINRPIVTGSAGIRSWIDTISAAGNLVPEYYIDFTNNFADAWTQFLNPVTNGHSVPDYWLHSNRLATFFASAIDSCLSSTVRNEESNLTWTVFPNPTSSRFSLRSNSIHKLNSIELINPLGEILFQWQIEESRDQVQIDFPKHFSTGIYFLRIKSGPFIEIKRVVIQ
ncbi:MAG: T9SS type A sorting domain-containing protein [Saprospiraceae bacterium]